jgi:hypothetical protein
VCQQIVSLDVRQLVKSTARRRSSVQDSAADGRTIVGVRADRRRPFRFGR